MFDSQLLTKANNGDVESQYQVGLHYYDEDNADHDYSKACEWFSKAANSGHADAQNKLANLLIDGSGIEKDTEKAIFWYTKAANQGNAAAQYNLGANFFSGDAAVQDYEKSTFWYGKSAEQGDADAQERLAYAYDEGIGIDKDLDKAFYWYDKAANNGSSWGMYGLGMCYLKGNGTEQDFRKAFEALSKSTQEGCNFAYFTLGQMYENGDGTAQNLIEAINCYKHAEGGDQQTAFFRIARIYDVLEDKVSATEWYIKSAEAGNLDSMAELCGRYIQGLGCKLDSKEAIRWGTIAAENGHLHGMVILAHTYAFEGTVKMSLGAKKEALEASNLAEKWFETAFSNGVDRNKEASGLSNLYCTLGKIYWFLDDNSTALKYAMRSNEPYAKLIKYQCLKSNTSSMQANGREIFAELSEAVLSPALDDYDRAMMLYSLGELHLCGIGTREDNNAAYDCFTRSANLGFEIAQDMLNKFKKKRFGGYEFLG